MCAEGLIRKTFVGIFVLFSLHALIMITIYIAVAHRNERPSQIGVIMSWLNLTHRCTAHHYCRNGDATGGDWVCADCYRVIAPVWVDIGRKTLLRAKYSLFKNNRLHKHVVFDACESSHTAKFVIRNSIIRHTIHDSYYNTLLPCKFTYRVSSWIHAQWSLFYHLQFPNKLYIEL